MKPQHQPHLTNQMRPRILQANAEPPKQSGICNLTMEVAILLTLFVA